MLSFRRNAWGRCVDGDVYEGLDRDPGCDSAAQDQAKGIVRPQGDAQSAIRKCQKQKDNAQGADESKLLAYYGENTVGEGQVHYVLTIT